MTITEKAARYVANMPPAISDSGGHNSTFAVAMALRHGFDLTEEEAWPILLEYNKRCEPPWDEKELRHKLAEGDKASRPPQPRGHLRGAHTRSAKPAKPAKPIRLRAVSWQQRMAEVEVMLTAAVDTKVDANTQPPPAPPLSCGSATPQLPPPAPSLLKMPPPAPRMEIP